MNEAIQINQTESKSKKLLYPFLAMLIGSLILIVTIFMPFSSAKGDYKKGLEALPETVIDKELDMTNKDAVNISLFEYARIYSAAAKTGGNNEARTISIICIVLIAAFGAFAVLTLLFSLLKKPIAAIIFNLLAFIVFCVTKWDFKDRGVIPNFNYDWGIAQYICYIGIIIVMVGAVAFLVLKNKDKKQRMPLGQ